MMERGIVLDAKTIAILWVVGILPTMFVCSMILVRRGYRKGLFPALLGGLAFLCWPVALVIGVLLPRKRMRYKECAHCRSRIPIDAGVCHSCSWPQPEYMGYMPYR